MSDLRQAVLDASVALIEEHGVRELSFREVARRAGVSHQAPYHHFGDYHGILRAVARDGFVRLAGAMREAAAAGGPDPVRGLEAAGVAYVLFAREHLGHFRVMFQQDLVDLHDEEDPVGEAGDAHGVLVGLVAAVRESGHGRHVAAETMVALCWAAVHGLAVLLVEGVLAGKGTATAAEQDALTRQVVEALGRLLEHGPPA